MKTCRICKEEKEFIYFFKNKKNIDGHHTYCKKCHQDYNRAKLYGLTIEEMYELLDNNPTCNICNVVLDKQDIDHCHETDVVRGVLCPKCNKMLGLVGDNIQILKNSIKYLTHERNKLLRDQNRQSL